MLCAVNTAGAFSADSTKSVKLGSAIANSSLRTTARFSTALSMAFTSPLKANTATASRGIALRIEPPRISERAKCGSF